MLVKNIIPTEQIVGILCDACGRSTKTTDIPHPLHE